MILNAYIDESESEDIFAMGGFAAPADEWGAFSDKWRSALATKPSIHSLKMSDAMRLRGDFYKWSPEARDEKLRLLYSVIDDHISFAVGAVIHMYAYRDIYRKDDLLRTPGTTPYVIALASLVSSIARHQIQIGMPEKIDFIFDERVMEQSRILEAWPALYANAPSDVKPMLGRTPIFRSDKNLVPLQAADLEAWWLRKAWEARLRSDIFVEYPWRPGNYPAMESVVDYEALAKGHSWMLANLGVNPAPWKPGNPLYLK